MYFEPMDSLLEKVLQSKIKEYRLCLRIMIVAFISLFISIILLINKSNITLALGQETNLETSEIYDKLIIEGCDELSLTDTANCLNKKIKKTFKYLPRNDDIILSIQELKEEGGDCKAFSDYYETNLNYRNFSTRRIQIPTERIEINGKNYSIYHVFVIAYDSTAYCKIDQSDLECFKYAGYSDKDLEDIEEIFK